jgi:hypothetical protein
MKDLRSKRLILLKGVLFLVCGTAAAALLLLEHPSPRTAFLLGIAIWAFARAYDFAFYAITAYVDASYRFSGLGSCLRYWARRNRVAPAAAASRSRSGRTRPSPWN